MAAIYVSNPKHRRRTKTHKAARRSAHREAAAAPKRRKNSGHARSASGRFVSKRPRAHRVANKGTGARRVYRKTRPARRRMVAARRANPGPARRPTAGRRRLGVRHIIVRRANGLTLSNPMGLGSVPVLGTALGLLGPALFGVISIETIGQTVKFVSELEFVQEHTPDVVKEWAPRVAYTIGGLILAGVLQLLTFIPAPYRHSLGLAMASAGGGVDWYRYRSESGAYGELSLGDGGSWSVVDTDDGLGDLELGALELNALEMGDYAGDEDYCGDDLSPEEGQAMANDKFLRRFPHHKGQRTRGVEGHRWRWMAQHAGPKALPGIAQLPPDRRMEKIRQLKAEFKAHHQRAAGGGGAIAQRRIGHNPIPSAMPDPALQPEYAFDNVQTFAQ